MHKTGYITYMIYTLETRKKLWWHAHKGAKDDYCARFDVVKVLTKIYKRGEDGTNKHS